MAQTQFRFTINRLTGEAQFAHALRHNLVADAEASRSDNRLAYACRLFDHLTVLALTRNSCPMARDCALSLGGGVFTSTVTA
jgi:hypothetical protein